MLPSEAEHAAQQARIAELETELAEAHATIHELIAGAAAGMAAGDGLVATLVDQVDDLQQQVGALDVEVEQVLDVVFAKHDEVTGLRMALLTQPPLGRH